MRRLTAVLAVNIAAVLLFLLIAAPIALAHQRRVSFTPPQPSPTAGVDLINGPEDNPKARHGWYGNRFAIPDYIILTCENHTGDYTRKIIGYHPDRRTASGAYMITKGTWDWFAGYREAYLAPPYLQDQKAALLWANGRGKSHWRSCL